MEENIKLIKKVFKCDDVKIVKRLLGGRSNFTYIMDVDSKLYTFRKPGKDGNLFVSRKGEIEVLKMVDKLKINNKTVFIDENSGVKISEYIEGTPLDFPMFQNNMEEIAQTLRSLHNSPKFTVDYGPFERLLKYEEMVLHKNYNHEEKYYEIKGGFLDKREIYCQKDIIVPCHNDTQPSNFILGDKIYLTDWEFGGNNDLYYDFASFAEVNFKDAFLLGEVYFKRELNDYEKNKIKFWRCFQALQWYNVATYKELIGLSEELGVDFKAASDYYLKFAENILSEID